MSVDQMLWHISQGLELALGQITTPAQKVPLPRPIMKFIVLNLPWPKGAPTVDVARATQEYDFEAERQRCLQLLDVFAAKKLNEPWPTNPIFGPVTGRFVSRVQTKHLDHHLKQFGV
jgi:DinB superfamily